MCIFIDLRKNLNEKHIFGIWLINTIGPTDLRNDGEWHITLLKVKIIMINHIFGQNYDKKKHGISKKFLPKMIQKKQEY